jgi:hypothetical protein
LNGDIYIILNPSDAKFSFIYILNENLCPTLRFADYDTTTTDHSSAEAAQSIQQRYP